MSADMTVAPMPASPVPESRDDYTRDVGSGRSATSAAIAARASSTRTARARSSAALLTILFRPEGPGPTLETADMLVHPEVLAAPGAEAEIGRVHDFWAMVIDQDIRAVERVE